MSQLVVDKLVIGILVSSKQKAMSSVIILEFFGHLPKSFVKLSSCQSTDLVRSPPHTYTNLVMLHSLLLLLIRDSILDPGLSGCLQLL